MRCRGRGKKKKENKARTCFGALRFPSSTAREVSEQEMIIGNHVVVELVAQAAVHERGSKQVGTGSECTSPSNVTGSQKEG